VRLKTSDAILYGEEVLLCPVCDRQYVHPISVKVATGLDLTVIDNEGTKVYRDVGKISPRDRIKGRGVRIIIEYYCEEGHHGNLIFQFHEGNTIVEHEVLEPLSWEEWKTLWRD